MAGFTREELEIAKGVDLTEVAKKFGYTVKRVGKYHTFAEMDSIRIYDRSNWFRWSRQYDKGENGGSQIDFLRVFAGMDIKEAVSWLLDFAGYRKGDDCTWKQMATKKDGKEKNKDFILPEPAGNNNHIYYYMINKRGISKEVIDCFLRRGLIYESRDYSNIVFKGNDIDGNTRFASLRGVYDRNGKGFKCDVIGSDKKYGFNVSNDNCDELIVFEAALDLMSYYDAFRCHDTNMLALGMLSDAPLTTFLKEYPQVKRIKLCLDRDEPGRKAAGELKMKYEKLFYEVSDCPPPYPYKDFNEWLMASKGLLKEHKRESIRVH